MRLRDEVPEDSGSCSTDTQLARRRPGHKDRQDGDLMLRGVPGFFGSAFFYVFFAAFGGILCVPRPLLGHPVLLLIVRSFSVPWEPELHAAITSRNTGSYPAPGAFRFVLMLA